MEFKFHGPFEEVPWGAHGPSMELWSIPWNFIANSMGNPWAFHGISGIPWVTHGTPMESLYDNGSEFKLGQNRKSRSKIETVYY